MMIEILVYVRAEQSDIQPSAFFGHELYYVAERGTTYAGFIKVGDLAPIIFKGWRR